MNRCKRIRRNALRSIAGALLALRLLPALTGAAATPADVAWFDNLNAALARASTEFKPLLVIITSPGCPWCERFKRETLAEREAVAALDNFVCVEIDSIRDPETPRRYQIRNVPATLILSGDGRLQWGTEGFMNLKAFLKFIDVYRQLGALPEGTPARLDDWLKALRTQSVSPGQWPAIVSALGDTAGRSRLHPALIAYAPAPRREWVKLLAHPKLAVRLGVFELLEELAGSGHGYDPWSDAETNREALERWRAWAETERPAGDELFAPLTEAQIHGYIRDLAAGDRERSARAVRMLEQAGEGVIPALEAWLAAGAPEETAAVRHVKEVTYFLRLPESLGTERARLAHRLVFGNQDQRLRSLEAAAKGGARSLPVLVDFLSDPDPFLREAAVDAVISADRRRAVTPLLALLRREREEAVIHAVVRGAGRLTSAHAIELAAPFLAHEDEDLVVAALATLGRTQAKPAAEAVAECLRHPRWRVRAAALETLARLNVKRMAPKVEACLEDADPFVRRSAVATLASLSAKKSAKRLKELFFKDDPLKGPVVTALLEIGVPLPESFGPALQGKDVDVLLPVIDALGDGSEGAWRLALPYVHHENGDVACAAIRGVARGGAHREEARRELVTVLRGGVKERMLAVLDHYPPENRDAFDAILHPFGAEDFEALLAEDRAAAGGDAKSGPLEEIFSAFSPAAAPAETAPTEAIQTPPVALDELFSAFGTPGKASAEGREDADLLREIRAVLETARDPDLRFAAALSLMAMGEDCGAAFLLETLDTCPAEDRLKIVRRAEHATGEAATELLERLLRDPSTDVRRAAVRRVLKESSNDRLLQAMLGAAFEPDPPLLPPDLLQQPYAWYQALRSASTRRIVGAAARQALNQGAEAPVKDSQRILALTLLDVCWRADDRERLQSPLESDNPFVRRAAWLALGRHRREDFLDRLDAVAQDPSEWVRAVAPAVFMPGASDVYFDAATVAQGPGAYGSASSASRRLDPAVAATLTTLCRDPAPAVRNASALCLLAHREKLDVRLLTAMLNSAPDKSSAAYRIESLLRDLPLHWLRAQNSADVLSLLDALLALKPDAEEADGMLMKLRRLLAERADGGANTAITVTLRRDEPRPAWPDALQASDVGARAVTETKDGRAAPRRVVFFRNPGCRDCERVAEMLGVLSGEWRDLAVEVRNIRNPGDARIHEALCERFDVPMDDRLATPAVFCGAGVLMKGDITFDRLRRLLSRPEAATVGWRRLSATDTEQAGQQIEAIYSRLTPLLVFGAGLADGVNPCAFAAIIFLLSYLQVARRKPRELLAVGGAFMAGVFLAYVALGLGVVEVVERLALLRRFARLFNWGLALFVAGVALLNFWDGVQCLRGRMSAMVLQLPGVFKRHIHGVVRHSARHRRFVLAAFLAGVAISLLELACTGQVYAPTLFYVMKAGLSRRGVFAYLLLYNVAFIVPLAIVFCGAYGGLRSERLTQWLRRRAAAVKFATAALFAALFLLLVLRLR